MKKYQNTNRLYISILITLMFISGCAEKKHSFWAKAYGGSGTDLAMSIIQTLDGGFALTGAYSVIDMSHFYGAEYQQDILVLKIDSSGSAQWVKTYGGENEEDGYSILQMDDGGYIVTGYFQRSWESDLDLLVFKISSKGELIWHKVYGGSNYESARKLKHASDEGFIVLGTTDSFGAGGTDIWVLKFAADGTLQWQKAFGGIKDDSALSIVHTSDGGYLIGGRTESFGAGEGDIWVLKISSEGEIEWQKTYGSIDDESAQDVLTTSDGGFIIGGRASLSGSTADDYLVIKVSANDSIEWGKIFGGAEDDSFGSLIVTADGGYIIAGRSRSFGQRWDDEEDVWLIKLSSDGTIQWQRTYGERGDDIAYSIQQTMDLGYIITGVTSSYGEGWGDVLIFKTDSQGFISDSCQALIGVNTNVVINGASVYPLDSTAVVQETFATVSDGVFTSKNPDISVETICTGDQEDIDN